jgi:hypothetical protein
VRDWQVTEMIFQAHKHQRMKSVEFSVRWLGSTALKDYSTLPQALVRTPSASRTRRWLWDWCSQLIGRFRFVAYSSTLDLSS